MSPPRPKLKLKGKGFTFYVPLGDGPIMPTAGGPNIEELARPGRPSITRNENQQLIRLDVPAFWDGLPDYDDVEPDMMDVVNLALGLPMQPFTAEGPFMWSGGRFVMDWPEWGKLWRPKKQRLVQAELVLKIIEFNGTGDLKPHHRGSGGAPGGDGGTRAPATITLPEPMNLVEVAAKYAGDPGEAKAIGNANGIHDIKKKQPKGTQLKIPAG